MNIIEALYESKAHIIACNTLLTFKNATEDIPELSNKCDQKQKVSVWRETEAIEVRMKMLNKNWEMIQISCIFTEYWMIALDAV